MKTSPAGRALIKRHEGLRLRTYVDPVGVLTIGYGHTGHAAKAGNEITKEEAELLFNEDLREVEDALLRLVKVNLSESQLDALASFVFNFGETRFAGSTLLRELNAGRYAAVPGQLRRWVWGTDKKTKVKVILPGLVKRRSDECVLWLSAEAVDDDSTEGGVIPEAPPAKPNTALGLAGAATAAAPVLQAFAGATPGTIAAIAAVALIGFLIWRARRDD